jgi:hypothetical protein
MQDYNCMSSTITVPLFAMFAKEMKYLHDNGFKVLALSQLGGNPRNDVFYYFNTPYDLVHVSIFPELADRAERGKQT